MYVTLAMLLGEPWSFQGSDFRQRRSVVMLVGALLFAIVFGEAS